MCAETVCGTCGGTVLPPTLNGVPRGTCHCPPGLDAIPACCRAVIARYEATDAAVAMARGGVALYCATCKARITFNGRWRREAFNQLEAP
jgi:hypothetical protein